MKVAIRLLGSMLALAMLTPAPASARHYDYYERHRHDDGHSAAVGAAVGLAIVGIAAAAAASKRKREREQENYYDNRNWGRSYEPAPGVVCYSDERRCYRRGTYSFDWTEQEFGYDPYRRGY